jgi:8-amino-3,8-dideoxy-alpha-D-manno-octulosonate transaminase
MVKVDWPRAFPGVSWLDDQVQQAVLDVLRSGALFRYYGPEHPRFVEALEAAARELYGTRYALAVGSGTGALITAMQALRIGPGCEVIVPSLMWVATIAAVVQNNAIPVLCEVDDSFNMDPEDLERKITSRTRLIVPVHMAGAPCDMAAIMRIADQHRVPVLEDCAQCNGGTFEGRAVGTFGAMGMFSLQINKNITAGEGGLLVTDDHQLYTRACSAHDLGVPWIDGSPADPDPDALAWGNGRRMSELCGAVASVQIRKLPEIVRHMRDSHRRLRSMLDGTPGVTFRSLRDEDGHTGSYLVMILNDESSARAVAARMNESGLSGTCRLADYGLHVYYNISSLTQKVPLSPCGNPWRLAENATSKYDYAKGCCPNSDALFARSILLPIPSRLTAQQERAAADAIRMAVDG